VAKWDGVFTLARGVALTCGCATLSGCGTPTQPRVEAVVPVSLDVIGPTSAAPGQTLHYTAMATYWRVVSGCHRSGRLAPNVRCDPLHRPGCRGGHPIR
jgi:hypothetical protein